MFYGGFVGDFVVVGGWGDVADGDVLVEVEGLFVFSFEFCVGDLPVVGVVGVEFV